MKSNVQMLTVTFGESTMSRTQAQLRYNQFKEHINDDALTTDVNIEAVKKTG